MEHGDTPLQQSLAAKKHLQSAIAILEGLRPAAEVAEMDISGVLDSMDLGPSLDEIDPLGTLIDHIKDQIRRGVRLGLLPPE